jgi:acyl-CoA synthetase (AMP-forming)/AMP-acid ligase II
MAEPGAPAVDRLWAHLAARGGDVVAYRMSGRWTAARLRAEAHSTKEWMATAGIGAGSVVALVTDPTPKTCATLLAAMHLRATTVLIGRSQMVELPQLLEVGRAEWIVDLASQEIVRRSPAQPNALLDQFRATGHAGLIAFSSGSTGAPKAILHDLERFVSRFFDLTRAGARTLQFLPLHHMGGVNTLFGALVHAGGMIVLPNGHSVAEVARLVEEAAVELLPVTPSFLNLLLASGAHLRHNFSSVKLITYGAEVMPEPLLARVRKVFPNAHIKQTYGLSEFAALPQTHSREDGSVWIRLGGRGFEVRVKKGLLQVRTPYLMVGYLDEPSPFDEEGWFNTGDAVMEDGEWIRVLGRASELINVGGEKVFPAEVEQVLSRADNVVDVTCFGERDPFLGARVVARVVLERPEDPSVLRQRLRRVCLDALARYKVPVRFEVSDGELPGGRFKKRRAPAG